MMVMRVPMGGADVFHRGVKLAEALLLHEGRRRHQQHIA